jgi:hypothetical protein
MAITIHQQPDAHSAISTPLIITASSTNSGNDGFKYVVRLQFFANDITYFVSKNAQNYLVFDIGPSVRPIMRNTPLSADGSNEGSIHSSYSEFYPNVLEGSNGAFNYNGLATITSSINEGWDVAGVFTVNDVGGQTIGPVVYNFLDFTIRNGYKPSLLAQIGHEDGDQSRLMSDRLPSTYYWQFAESVGLNPGNAIYVPTRESDWGVWSIREWDGVDVAVGAKKVLLSILPNAGAPVQQEFILSYEETFSHLCMYPANLNASTLAGILKPQDYPNWKAIYFQILNEADEQVSMTYVMFNIDREQTGICTCHDYEVVRLAWVGRRGGWEYYNFTMLSETEYQTEQKTAKKVVGNYGEVEESTDFKFNTFDESDFVTYKKIDKFITASTEKLQQGEWEFLKGLILSKQVHWVHDDGTHTPVIIQDTNFRVKNPQAKTLEPLQVRFKIAQDQPN